MKLTPAEDLERRIPASEIVGFLIVGLFIEFIQGFVVPSFLHADVLLVLVVYVASHSDPLKGALVGTLFGMVQDFLLGVPVGLNGLGKSLIAFGASYLNRWASADLGTLRILIIALLAILDRGIVLATLFILGLEVAPVRPLDILSAAALTGIVGEVFFRLYDKIRFPPKDFRRL